MSAHVLLNLLNEFLFHNKFYKFNNTCRHKNASFYLSHDIKIAK